MDELFLKAHETVYRSLRSKIMYGEIDPGRMFSIRSLAADFSVSMTPIREATRRLVAEGALTMSTSGRISAPLITPTREKELLAIRHLIEPELALKAVPRVHSALIERLSFMSKVIGEMIAARDCVGFIKANFEFHKSLYLRAQAPTMLAILETIWLRCNPTFKIALENNLNAFDNSTQRNVLSALREKNPVKLVKTINNSVNIYVNVLKDPF